MYSDEAVERALDAWFGDTGDWRTVGTPRPRERMRAALDAAHAKVGHDPTVEELFLAINAWFGNRKWDDRYPDMVREWGERMRAAVAAASRP